MHTRKRIHLLASRNPCEGQKSFRMMIVKTDESTRIVDCVVIVVVRPQYAGTYTSGLPCWNKMFVMSR